VKESDPRRADSYDQINRERVWRTRDEFRTVLSIELGSVTLKINNQQSLMYDRLYDLGLN